MLVVDRRLQGKDGQHCGSSADSPEEQQHRLQKGQLSGLEEGRSKETS